MVSSQKKAASSATFANAATTAVMDVLNSELFRESKQNKGQDIGLALFLFGCILLL